MTNPNPKPPICAACQTTQSSRWSGMRKGRTVCFKCYQRESKAKKRAKRPLIYAWAGEA